MITCDGDPRHVDLLLLHDYGLEHGQRRGKTVSWDKPEFSAKNPLAGAHLPADQARTFKSRCTHCIDWSNVQFASKEISAAMSQPTINADETLKGLARYHLSAPGMLWCFPRQHKLSKIVRLSDANSVPCYTRELRVQPLDAGERPKSSQEPRRKLWSLCHQERAAVRGACRTLGLAALM